MSLQSFPSGDGPFSPHMTAATWRQRLDVARTPQEVVDIARDFVAAFTAYELYALPEACRPSTKLFAEDIAHLAFELVRHGCATAEDSGTAQRLAAFFAHASGRLAQLAVYGDVGRAKQGSRSGAI